VIQPVRAVGISVSSVAHVLYSIRCRLARALAENRTIYAVLGRSLLTEGLRSRPSRVVIPLAFACYYPYPLCGHPEILGQSRAGPVEPWQQWQPWPAHGAFADEITRWWPSDEWPSLQPPPVIEDTLPDAPPELISWRDHGGLLDLWI